MPELRIRLSEGTMPAGEIRAVDAKIILALQEMTLRIARAELDAAGPGRSKRTVEELTELRLAGLTEGSTTLVFSQGPSDALPLELELEARLRSQLWDVLEAIADDVRPPWVSDLVADSAGDLVAALQHAAPSATFTTLDERRVVIHAVKAHRETWMTPTSHPTDESVSIVGTLEKVDLRDHTFRVRDELGHGLELRRVADAETAARLVGLRVHAEGIAVRNRTDLLIGLDEPILRTFESSIAPSPDPDARPDVRVSATAADPSGIFDLTDEEYAEFLTVIGR